jgi:hypothetical protein
LNDGNLLDLDCIRGVSEFDNVESILETELFNSVSVPEFEMLSHEVLDDSVVVSVSVDVLNVDEEG